MKLQKAGVVHVLNMESLSLDNGDSVGHGSNTFQARKRLLHVVQNPEIEHHIEEAESVEIHRRKVIQDRFDLRIQHALCELESSTTRKFGAPEVGQIARMVRHCPGCLTLAPVRVTCLEIDSPRIIVERRDFASTAAFCKERVVAIPCPDIQNRVPCEVRKIFWFVLTRAQSLGYDTLSQVDRAEPNVCICFGLQLVGCRHHEHIGQ